MCQNAATSPEARMKALIAAAVLLAAAPPARAEPLAEAYALALETAHDARVQLARSVVPGQSGRNWDDYVYSQRPYRFQCAYEGLDGRVHHGPLGLTEGRAMSAAQRRCGDGFSGCRIVGCRQVSIR